MTQTLTNIEALARFRELHGYLVLDALRRILHQALEQPECPPRELIVAPPSDSSSTLSSSDQLSDGLSPIAVCPAAVAFLIENGFMRVMNEAGGEEVTTTAPKTGWQDRKRELIAAISLVQWASDCNTALLTLRVSGLKVLEPLEHSAEHRIEITVEWDDELGKRKKLRELSKPFLPLMSNMSPSRSVAVPLARAVTPSRRQDEEDPAMSPASRQVTSAFADADGEQRVELSSITAPSSSFPTKNTNHCHYDISELFSTQCDRRCEVTVMLFRRRAVLADKLLCFACFEYSNFAALSKEVELRDPDHPERLPIGRLHVTIDSITHRCFAIETAARLEKCTPLRLSQYVSPKNSPQQGPLTPPRSPRVVELLAAMHSEAQRGTSSVPCAAAWIGPSVLKSPPSEGRRYDADDYF